MSDYSVFASPQFNPNDYANAVLAGEQYNPLSEPKPSTKTGPAAKASTDSAAKEDISVAISKLSFGIDDVTKHIKNVVTTHHEDLLTQAAGANGLTGSLKPVRSGLNDLDASVDKLRLKIHVPYESLQTHVTRLQKLHQVSDLLRRTSRFVILARRLQMQMKELNGSDGNERADGSMNPDEVNGMLSASASHILDVEDEKERTIAKAALSIAELVALLDNSNDSRQEFQQETKGNETIEATPLRNVRVVSAHEAFIEEARIKVTNAMENMVITGLGTSNQAVLASSLQTAYNLRVLPSLVQNLILDLSHAVDARIRNTFDVSKISKDALAKDPLVSSQNQPSYRSRVRTEPTNVTAPQWSNALWSRLETMFEEMADCCIKVYTLEKVLKIKKDTTTQVIFLDEAMKVLENTPSATFWTSLAQSLEKNSRDSANGSTFVQQTLGIGYPRLLRLFHEFFAKITVHTDTVYTDSYQSPETVLVLHSVSKIESFYLTKSINKLNEAIGHAFSGSSKASPDTNSGITIARTISNELDAARFDPLLVKAVAKNVMSSLDMILSRADGLATRDRSAVTLQGPSATPQQISNAQLANCLYHCWVRLTKLSDEHAVGVFNIIQSSVQGLQRFYERLLEPLRTAIRRELGAIIAKVHRVDFGKSVDPMSGMGGASIYTKELTEKLAFIRSEVLNRYNLGEDTQIWVQSIVKFVIKTFLLHISIVKPLGESGKLQMTSDMTELEFALNAFMAGNQQSKRGDNLEVVGEEYRALRAMRPLLFLENSQLASAKHAAGLPPLIVLHHILVRSPIPLPHSLHGWQEAEYVRWVGEHSEGEALSLVEGGLSRWERISEDEHRDTTSWSEYVSLARAVLKSANT
ncbi:Golgi transport complex subunit 5-domain-containing protein [Crucibulum laeve]|uniref:Conserved oligomeric Golgi complex subunit 5 n=1 Tax=Crucibulum laeve TaxID=68775 RepID=A0A5C3MKV2_9AGAR|nr:Golgi transport complex subunit 5-domain-containing protein [Crucibulum laeve]